MRKPVAIFLFLLVSVVFETGHAAPANYDFRILIDVTGSMQQNDPGNSRVEALKLLNGLIPDGAKAGVWTFGRYVNMTVKWGKVDTAWRQAADLAAEQIYSNGQFTNIERALSRATSGWKKPDKNTRRIILLLTDGQVKISSKPKKNKKSRDTILGKTLVSLKAMGVSVYGIALSDQADTVLLRRLAMETGGAFVFTEKTTELPRIFFRMMMAIGDPDLVTLAANEFPVDASIREMTLLMFRSDATRPGELIPPAGPTLSARQPGKSTWRSGLGYDLVKIVKPAVGTWRIDAPADVDNRLMAVTDLKLELGEVPTHITPLAGLKVVTELRKRDKTIRKNSYLRFVEFKLTHINIDGIETSYPMKPSSERHNKGQYLFRGRGKLQEGVHGFIVSAESRSYTRSKRFEIEVRWPVVVKLEPGFKAGVYQLSLKAREEFLKPESLVAKVEIEAPDGSRTDLPMKLSLDWYHARIETSQAGLYQAHIKLSAVSNTQQNVDIDLGSFPMDGVYRAVPEPVSTLSTN